MEQVKPLYMLAEDNSKKELLNSAFDFCYNWSLYDTLFAVAKGEQNANDVKADILQNLPDGTYSLNFLDNHDKNSYENTILDAFGEDALPAIYEVDNENIFAFYREKDGNTVKCLYNLSDNQQTIEITGMFDRTETILLHGQKGEVLYSDDCDFSEIELGGSF